MNGEDSLDTALKMRFSSNGTNGSFFPAAQTVAQGNSDLLNQIDNTFFSGPAPTPTPKPTPTPTPTKPTQMSLAQLYDHFGVPNQPIKPPIPAYQNNQIFNPTNLYGYT